MADVIDTITKGIQSDSQTERIKELVRMVQFCRRCFVDINDGVAVHGKTKRGVQDACRKAYKVITSVDELEREIKEMGE